MMHFNSSFLHLSLWYRVFYKTISRGFLFFGCFLLVCHYVNGDNHLPEDTCVGPLCSVSEVETGDKNVPEIVTEDENAPEVSTEDKNVPEIVTEDKNVAEAVTEIIPEEEYVKTSRLAIKSGFKWYSKGEVRMFQFPVLLEFQHPITTSGNFKWLVQSGIGKMNVYGLKGYSEIFKEMFDQALGLRDSTSGDLSLNSSFSIAGTGFKPFDKKTFRLSYLNSFPYYSVQTGFQYDFGLKTSLVGGVLLGGPSTVNWTGSLLVGTHLVSDILSLELGVDALYYDEYLYWGLSLSLGLSLKEWTRYISEI